ncbi:MAG: hypothetical protein PHV34_13160 [Verrucomicrobiae bacterium]|nr:hypothetical protein [Verrucomicrobiae bacterium]
MMIKTMIFFALFLGINPIFANALPMDAEAGKKLPEIKSAIENIRKNGSISDKDQQVVAQDLASGDGVLISLAAYAIGQSKKKETSLCAKAEEILKTNTDAMAEAFVRLTLLKKSAEGKTVSERIALLEALLKTANPFLRVEAAKEIFRIHPQKGEGALKKIALEDANAIAKSEAFNQLDKIGKRDAIEPTFQPSERYQLLLSIIEK